MKHVKSLRDYIEALKQLGEVQEIEREVDWNLEIGAIIRRCNETGAPAPLFNTIRGIEKGFRVFGAPAGVSQHKGLYLARMALSLGLDAHASGPELVTALAQARERPLLAPRRVETAAHKQHILRGDEVDLLRFPTPLIHQADGGRYFNTWGTIVVQSPDKKWTNWSITRMMLLDGKRMTGLIHSQQHVGRIHAMWRELGKPTPFALVQGCEPAVPLVSGMSLPEPVDESAFLGAYFGEPLEVVRCEMSDLEVPATAEIVAETSAKSGMLTARIYNHRALQVASRVVSQVANGCAAHDWGQVLMFEGKSCSPFGSFTSISSRQNGK
jgi:UbiD family decarboxylase